MNPTFAGFLSFVRNQAGFGQAALPDDSVYLTWCYEIAIETVNRTLQWVAPTVYALAVYNLGTSYLVNFAEDTPPDTTFSMLRKKLDIDGPALGSVTSTSDEGTSVSVQAPDFFSQLSLEELQQLKDPFGRRYLALAQKAGSVWGLN